MSESQSFVETTLPPGYGGEQYEIGKRLGMKRTGGRVVLSSRAKICRSAWRHWTATVPRGRMFADPDDGSMVPAVWWLESATIGRCELFDRIGGDVLASIERRDWGRGVDAYYIQSSRSATIALCHDVDEAMARFAALVLATEGMVTR